MRLLLASAGMTNASIRDVLVDLLRKPIADSTEKRIASSARHRARYVRSPGLLTSWA